MQSLTEGALDKIMNGIDVDKPVLQILGHKKLTSSSCGERYRLLMSDGERMNWFAVLATQLNSMITDNILSEFSICEINRYAMNMVNNAGKQKRVMVILNIEVKVPGEEVGHKIGNPTSVEPNNDSESAQFAQRPAPQQRNDVFTPKQSTHQSSMNDISTTLIVALRPYQNRWVIKAQVVSKSNIRTWSNSRGEGKLFSMDLVDESSEIRCTAFNDQCDQFYDMIEVGKVYYISRATLKTAKKQFNNLNNDYEMSLTGDSKIIPCHDAEKDILSLHFNFLKINEIEKKEKNDIIDVFGIVKSVGDIQMLVSRQSGRELRKRDVDLIDESNVVVCLTLWGAQAEEFDGSSNAVVAIKGARVTEFNGEKSISTLSQTVLRIDPDIPEAHRLRDWFNQIGRNENIKSISRGLLSSGDTSEPWLTFKEAIDLELGFQEPDTYTVKATVNMICIENALYKSCPTDTCKKKMINQANHMYRCEKCDKEYPNCRYRLMLNLNLVDWTDNQWATAFGEEAEKLLGITAQELGKLQENDNDAYLKIFRDASFKSFIFKMRVRLEAFNDGYKLKATCVSASPVNYKTYNDHLITKIKELVCIEKA